MRIFYGLTKAIKDSLESNSVTNTVTFGDITQVDLNKQSIFPLAHLIVNSASLNGSTVSLDMSIILCDIVDYSQENAKDQPEPFYGHDNTQDILDTQLYVANLLAQELTRGNLWDEYYQVESAPTLEPFLDRFENVLAGWVLNVSINVRNTDLSIC